VLVYYWVLSAGFVIVEFFAFRLQDGMTRYFSAHEALDIAEAVLFAELMTFAVLFTLTRLDGIPRSIPLVHGLLLAVGLLAARVFVRIVASEDNEPPDYHWRRERIILIGANPFASSFIQLLKAYAPHQQGVIAVLDENAEQIKTKLVTFVTDNVRLVGIVGDKDLLARMSQDKEQPHRREGTKKVAMRQQ
jgi:FlaA1/EpsC-like NDP-sugar epimerase